MPNTHLASLANHLPDDDFWAARNVMSFTDDDIRALVKTGQYSDRRAEDWIAKCLIERRNKIGRVVFSKVLPLDSFRVEDGELKSGHLAARYGLEAEPAYRIQWTVFNNFSQEHTPIAGAPADGSRRRFSVPGRGRTSPPGYPLANMENRSMCFCERRSRPSVSSAWIVVGPAKWLPNGARARLDFAAATETWTVSERSYLISSPGNITRKPDSALHRKNTLNR